MTSLFDKIFTYYQLGLINLVHVFVYRLAVRFGYFISKLPIKNLNPKQQVILFFDENSTQAPQNISQPKMTAFGWQELDFIDKSTKPNWLASITTGKKINNNQQHWSQLGDFDLDVGDIKTVWELSRFHWSLHFALQYLADSDESHLRQLNTWLSDWCFHNPVNQGANWKCGQEASIRVMHLAATCFLLKQTQPLSTPLAELIYCHLQRIAPTIHYAMAQDNNHGTSEATALFIGSLLLANHPLYAQNEEIKKWQKTGRYWLENRAKKLIAIDGAFSQNSVNYHRLMLDTLSLAEFFRQHFQQPRFSDNYYLKVRKACQWLKLMTEPNSGKTPILGLNDGAQLLPVTTCDYLDYRPSVQWAYRLFLGSYVYPEQDESQEQCSYQQLCDLFPSSNTMSIDEVPCSHSSDLTTSYRLLSANSARCYLRTPNTRFRPAKCDALHIDFWLGDKNIFVGTGSYSYNCEQALQEYFPSVRAHNTVQFDQLEQMPKISRFLFAHWINTQVQQINGSSLVAAYSNKRKHSHQRKVTLSDASFEVVDTVTGFKNTATIRWHLADKSWQLCNNRLTSGNLTIDIFCEQPIAKIALVDGLQSRYYLKKDTISVLEVTVEQPCSVSTILSWQ